MLMFMHFRTQTLNNCTYADIIRYVPYPPVFICQTPSESIHPLSSMCSGEVVPAHAMKVVGGMVV